MALDVLDVAGSFDVQITDALLEGKTRITSSRGDVLMRDTSCGENRTAGSRPRPDQTRVGAPTPLDIQYRSVNMLRVAGSYASYLGRAAPHDGLKVHYDRDGNGKVTPMLVSRSWALV